jgi:hypothetical protein
MDVPEGSIPLRALEVVQFLAPDGQEVVSARWQGTGNVVAELGMVEYAKAELILARFHLAEDTDDDDTSAGS